LVCGTVFRFDQASATVLVLHRFEAAKDGSNPQAAVIDAEGSLYSSTPNGADGFGTIFRMKP
jgi:hypothetical protein